MAEIIGYDESARRRVTCGGCAAIIQYTKSEVQTVNGTDIGGGPDGCEYVKCPGCGDRAVVRSW